jgi:hypothetical protein
MDHASRAFTGIVVAALANPLITVEAGSMAFVVFHFSATLPAFWRGEVGHSFS